MLLQHNTFLVAVQCSSFHCSTVLHLFYMSSLVHPYSCTMFLLLTYVIMNYQDSVTPFSSLCDSYFLYSIKSHLSTTQLSENIITCVIFKEEFPFWSSFPMRPEICPLSLCHMLLIILCIIYDIDVFVLYHHLSIHYRESLFTL